MFQYLIYDISLVKYHHHHHYHHRCHHQHGCHCYYGNSPLSHYAWKERKIGTEDLTFSHLTYLRD